MTLATVLSHTLVGISALPVSVQADVSRGLPAFHIVGMAQAEVVEARHRVKSAIRASGLDFPTGRVVLNLAPAMVRKRGTGFDLPMAAALLVATGQLDTSVLAGRALVGELSLDGSVHPVPGILAHALEASEAGLELLGPASDAGAIARLPAVMYIGIHDLRGLVSGGSLVTHDGPPIDPPDSGHTDMAEVSGHTVPRRALEIAAAGGHNLLMTGPPGSGKTLLGRCLCSILPPLEPKERVETALIHSVAGMDASSPLAGIRPFRAVHHSSTTVGLVGGGRPLTPGEASLAHNGVLFLDELSEFAPRTLQSLRQPLEDGSVTLIRAEERVTFPSRFMLVGATNPCPCGYLSDPGHRCRCTSGEVRRHTNRIGGPLMDRIDLVVRVDRVDPSQIVRSAPGGEASKDVRRRVMRARTRLVERGVDWSTDRRRLVEACAPEAGVVETLVRRAKDRGMSARTVVRILRLSRTIADLDARERVIHQDVQEAISLKGWAREP